jgi:hypothetical protein
VGNFSATITINDDDGGSGFDSLSVAVREESVLVLEVPATVNEGAVFTATLNVSVSAAWSGTSISATEHLPGR